MYTHAHLKRKTIPLSYQNSKTPHGFSKLFHPRPTSCFKQDLQPLAEKLLHTPLSPRDIEKWNNIFTSSIVASALQLLHFPAGQLLPVLVAVAHSRVAVSAVVHPTLQSKTATSFLMTKTMETRAISSRRGSSAKIAAGKYGYVRGNTTLCPSLPAHLVERR